VCVRLLYACMLVLVLILLKSMHDLVGLLLVCVYSYVCPYMCMCVLIFVCVWVSCGLSMSFRSE
jgi:hypothetical protein